MVQKYLVLLEKSDMYYHVLVYVLTSHIADWASTGTVANYSQLNVDFFCFFPVPVGASEFGLARQARSSRPASARPFRRRQEKRIYPTGNNVSPALRL